MRRFQIIVFALISLLTTNAFADNEEFFYYAMEAKKFDLCMELLQNKDFNPHHTLDLRPPNIPSVFGAVLRNMYQQVTISPTSPQFIELVKLFETMLMNFPQRINSFGIAEPSWQQATNSSGKHSIFATILLIATSLESESDFETYFQSIFSTLGATGARLTAEQSESIKAKSQKRSKLIQKWLSEGRKVKRVKSDTPVSLTTDVKKRRASASRLQPSLTASSPSTGSRSESLAPIIEAATEAVAHHQYRLTRHKRQQSRSTGSLKFGGPDARPLSLALPIPAHPQEQPSTDALTSPRRAKSKRAESQASEAQKLDALQEEVKEVKQSLKEFEKEANGQFSEIRKLLAALGGMIAQALPQQAQRQALPASAATVPAPANSDAAPNPSRQLSTSFRQSKEFFSGLSGIPK